MSVFTHRFRVFCILYPSNYIPSAKQRFNYITSYRGIFFGVFRKKFPDEHIACSNIRFHRAHVVVFSLEIYEYFGLFFFWFCNETEYYKVIGDGIRLKFVFVMSSVHHNPSVFFFLISRTCASKSLRVVVDK